MPVSRPTQFELVVNVKTQPRVWAARRQRRIGYRAAGTKGRLGGPVGKGQVGANVQRKES